MGFFFRFRCFKFFIPILHGQLPKKKKRVDYFLLHKSKYFSLFSLPSHKNIFLAFFLYILFSSRYLKSEKEKQGWMGMRIREV